MSNPTDVSQFMTDVGGGVLESQLSKILSEVAAAAVDNRRKGAINIALDIKRIGESYQVEISHKLTYKKPTLSGDITENTKGTSAMHVGVGGKLTLYPEDQVPKGQQHMFKGDGSVMNKNEQEQE